MARGRFSGLFSDLNNKAMKKIQKNLKYLKQEGKGKLLPTVPLKAYRGFLKGINTNGVCDKEKDRV